MQYKIVFAETAARDLSQIFEYIAEQSSTERALAYLSRLQESIYSLKQFPERGTKRDDVRAGLRTVGFERRITVAFEVGETQVTILRVLFGGRQFK